MSTETTTAERPEVPHLTGPEKGLMGVGALAAAGVGALGLASSFNAVSEAAVRWGFTVPWMLPVGIDAAIPAFTVANLLLIRMGMALAWVRFVPWLLTLVTCWLNIAAGHSLSAKVAHGTMPLLWVAFSEIAAHIYAVRVGVATGRRMEKIRATRWLLAFPSTFALWRRMTLWEVTDYQQALEREKARQLARADLREEYGWRWRKRTPRRERVLLKLGDLTPAAPDTTPDTAPDAAPPEPPGASGGAARPPAKRPRKPKAGKQAPRSAAELLSEARRITAEWPDDGLNAEAIRTALHCSAANSRSVRDALRAERADGRRLHTVGAAPAAEAVAG